MSFINSVFEKLYDFNVLFEKLYQCRKDDLIRAVEARQASEKRQERSRRILKYYENKIGEHIEPLSEYELKILKDTWKDIWDLGVVNPEWYAIHKAKTGVFDPNIIGTDLHFFYTEWNKIDFDYLRGFLDKNYADVILPCIKQAKVYVRKIHGVYRDINFKKITLDQAVDYLYSIRKIGAVVKISVSSSGGKGITFISEADTRKSIEEKLTSNRDIIVQEVIRQHKDMQLMNSSSINTLRVISIMIDGESIPLSTVVRIGKAGSRVDNFSSGGYACGVNIDGSLKEFAFDSSGKWFKKHTNGFIFKDGKIPSFDKVLEIIKECHNRVSVFGVVSWDIAITEDGEPLLIEYNVGQGQIDLHQYCNGPVYKEYREKIINDVFANYTTRNGNLDFNYSVKNKVCSILKGSKLISEIVIPANIDNTDVKRIEANCFSENANLSKVFFESKIDSIGYCAFYKCQKLSDIVFGGSVEEFGRSCFNSCSSIKKISLPVGTKRIGFKAFAYCSELNSIYIPDSVEVIENDAFLECPNVVVYCKSNSVAYYYAKNNNIRYKIY